MEEADRFQAERAIRLIRQLQDRLEVLTAIQRAGRRLFQLRSTESLAAEISAVIDALSFEYVTVLLIDESTGVLIPYAVRGQHRDPEGGATLRATLAAHELRVGKGITGWVAQTGQSVRVSDVHQDERYYEVHSDTRSELCVALRIGQQILGVVNVETSRRDAFTEVDQQALEAFADQISIAVYNARLYEQVRRHAEELEQNSISRTVTLEQKYQRQAALAEIELAINEPHELQVVLDRIAKITTELLPATGGVNVIIWEPETESYFIGSSTVPGQVPQRPADRIRREGGATRWIIDHRQSLVVSDVRDDPFGANRMMTIFFNQAYVGTPLMVGYEVLGVLYAFDKEPRQYTREDLDFLNALANRASAAISKVRVFESERKQRKLAETLRAANMALTQTLDLDTVLEALLIFLEQLVPYDGANVMLIQEESRIVIRAVRGYDGLIDHESLRKITFDAHKTRSFRTIMTTQRSLLIPDTAKYPGWEHGRGTDFIRCWMGVPMVAGGKIIGFYSIDKQVPDFFSQENLRAAETLAAQGAIAIQNARLFGDVQRLAVTDPLTNTNNRRHFFDLAERELSRGRRFARPVSVIMIDIDHFKQVNDTFGHATGDQVLSVLVERMQNNIRDIDILGRYGGEEFVVLLPETDEKAAERVSERLREAAMESLVVTDRGAISITISLGVAVSSKSRESLNDLIERADVAMYLAKQAGGNTVKFN